MTNVCNKNNIFLFTFIKQQQVILDKEILHCPDFHFICDQRFKFTD